VEDETSDDRDLLLEVTHDGTAARLRVMGELDASTAPDLSDLCLTVYNEGARDVVIDLTDTSFLDSSGLRALVGARQLFATDGRLSLSHASEPVLRLLDITGLTGYFTIDDGRDR
jgi:anti-sigma B factor antagonist